LKLNGKDWQKPPLDQDIALRIIAAKMSLMRSSKD